MSPADKNTTLVVIPTYQEGLNISEFLNQLITASKLYDILVVDDSSPDGTGAIVESIAKKNNRVHLLSRPKRSGIGGAHQAGILWGYARGYTKVATMDADLTHAPADLVRMLSDTADADIIVASRFLSNQSLPGWSFWRKFLTMAGHQLTRIVLQMPYDATGALRVYTIQNIPQRAFEMAQATGYAFIFEILLILDANKFRIKEVPVVLPARILGSSKMSLREIRRSVLLILTYGLIRAFLSERIRIVDPAVITENSLIHGSEWDSYWGMRSGLSTLVYDVIAGWYRRLLIRPSFEVSIRKNFRHGALLLHAGCGGGQVDIPLVLDYRITALDSSMRALELYCATNGTACELVHGDLLKLPFPDSSFDGVYNLGVMEHFREPDLTVGLSEIARVLKPDGKVVFWWPPEFGSSVFILKILRRVISLCTKQSRENLLFPDECSRIQSREQIEQLFQKSGLKLTQYSFGPSDMFTQVCLVAGKSNESGSVNLQPLQFAVVER